MDQRFVHENIGVTADDAALLDRVQRASFEYFWKGAHPSGLARDRSGKNADPANDLVATGASGFGFMAIVVAIERGWIERSDAMTRIEKMLTALERTKRYHGVFPHFFNGTDGSTIPFSFRDDGGDLVETSFLFQGLICVRQYFASASPADTAIRDRINRLWHAVEWTAHIKHDEKVLYWHHSPRFHFARNVPIRGWNEALITYVIAAGASRHSIDAEIYHEGFATGSQFVNGRDYYGINLPLGPDFGGPLFFAHYSFCGLDPRGLTDRYADYWLQNTSHVQINYQHCVNNPHGYKGYGPDCWGLTSSHGPAGYVVSSPASDFGLIAPTAAICSLPYLPQEAMAALYHFFGQPEGKIWGRFGFVDAFSQTSGWFARTYLGIDQGPIVAMVENHRSGLLWNLFMSAPEILHGLQKLGFSSPHLATEVREGTEPNS
ncbi:beta-glucosidase [Phyllobacterium sp. 628]|uniref:glucoamylase family protein n=1 Tax=Phyllobacterium sp. 628 TaxID=2718938 RepID=UPI001662615A|nr:glucoamylase family protein [Phyllobacterium sp. 628]QND53321.1 beta-glucosidase [Phyllobacterium sp. 628]